MDDIKMIEFLEDCEKSFIKQLCFKCPELTTKQIDTILEIFRDEIDKQLQSGK